MQDFHCKLFCAQMNTTGSSTYLQDSMETFLVEGVGGRGSLDSHIIVCVCMDINTKQCIIYVQKCPQNTIKSGRTKVTTTGKIPIKSCSFCQKAPLVDMWYYEASHHSIIAIFALKCTYVKQFLGNTKESTQSKYPIHVCLTGVTPFYNCNDCFKMYTAWDPILCLHRVIIMQKQ